MAKATNNFAKPPFSYDTRQRVGIMAETDEKKSSIFSAFPKAEQSSFSALNKDNNQKFSFPLNSPLTNSFYTAPPSKTNVEAQSSFGRFGKSFCSTLAQPKNDGTVFSVPNKEDCQNSARKHSKFLSNPVSHPCFVGPCFVGLGKTSAKNIPDVSKQTMANFESPFTNQSMNCTSVFPPASGRNNSNSGDFQAKSSQTNISCKTEQTRHVGVFCDNCHKNSVVGTKHNPIVGVRYRCSMCANYDLCETCMLQNEKMSEASKNTLGLQPAPFHDDSHVFFRLATPVKSIEAYPVIMNRSTAVHTGVTCSVCQTKDPTGYLYKCQECPNVHLCEACESQGKHHIHHARTKISVPSK
mmetsp:Transcript_12400/g.19080  ORF Transcript_12400/g.19080 Transcript_12400/m.19080 type:complete len:354 (+) Transcript_12400:115-1176(+)